MRLRIRERRPEGGPLWRDTVHHRLIRQAKPVAAALAVLLSMAAVAPPAQAATPAASAPQTATLTATASAKVAALSTAEIAASQDAAQTDAPRGFFKTRKGVIALLLFAGATTFTFVSKSRDRVKSPIRD
jgi:hypothetical protein